MKTVLAAIDSSAAATPVLATAAAIAKLYGATSVEALHLGDDRDGAARSLARAAGVELRTVRGLDVKLLAVAAETDDAVVAMVLGARGLPQGRRPVGSTALALITQMTKPLVVVPPQATTHAIERMLVPLDGTHASAAAIESTIRLAQARNVEVVLLHVQCGATIPRFTDQVQHETEAWSGEFLARNCPSPRDVRLKVRTGVPGASVLQVAETMHANLIALCWSRVLSPDRAAVVREVLERGAIPVLLVPVMPVSAAAGP
jgi:nucleotide-binding universal stress UspA family protein